jgi:hypothetical protein
MTVDELVACGVEAKPASWLQPFVKKTVEALSLSNIAGQLGDKTLNDMLSGLWAAEGQHPHAPCSLSRHTVQQPDSFRYSRACTL